MGISAGGATTPMCNYEVIRAFSVVTRSATDLPDIFVCPFTPTLSVSSFSGKSMTLVTGSEQTYSLSCTIDTGGACPSSRVY